MAKWQDVRKWLIGSSVGIVVLFSALFLLTGIDYTSSGDIVCGKTCESYINVTTTYWRICFDNYDSTKYENETLFKKQTRSRTLHVNLDHVDNIITTEPEIQVDWLVPTYGKNWRPIKGGDCWERGKVNKIKLVGHKEFEQTIKWNFDLGDKVNIDPLWEGIDKEPINYQTNKYDLGGGKFAQTSYLGFINYKKGSEFKPINMNLIDHGDYWKTIESVYYPTIPKYADEWSEFNNVLEGNNHSIKTRPVAEHVEGIADGNVVLYQDAFGKGFDLEVTAFNEHLLRKIIIKEPQIEALFFEFEIDIDEILNYKSVDRAGKKTLVGLGSELKEKGIIFDEGKSPTIIYPMIVWDSNNSIEYLDFKLYQKDGKIYFRKEISKKFLENAVYPVFTDDDTGAISPGTMADDDTVGSFTWSNVDNAKSSNNAYAIHTCPSYGDTHYLKATNFGFSIAGTIDGILVEIERKQSGGPCP